MPKRDSKYYLERLERDHPAIHKELIGGKLASVREACRKAGLRKPVTALEILKREWKKASADEKRDFLAWAHGKAPKSAAVAPLALVSTDRRLTPAAKTLIERMMKDEDLKLGQLMKKLGLSPLNASLGQALHNDTRISLDLATKLQAWVTPHPS